MGLRFSVVTPTKDRHDWLPRCIESVQALGFDDYEHLIFDNGEPCQHLLPNDPHIRYEKGEATGPADAFDQAIKLARGEIITLLSDDDRITPDALEVVDGEIGDALWLTALTDFQDEHGNSKMTLGGPLDLPRLQADYYLGGAIYWKRELTERLGGMNSDFDSAADYDLYLRFAKDSTPVFVDRVLYEYCYHAGVDSIVNSSRQQDATRRIKEAA